MKVPLLELKAQYQTIKDEVLVATRKLYETQRFILRPEVEKLEERSNLGTPFTFTVFKDGRVTWGPLVLQFLSSPFRAGS